MTYPTEDLNGFPGEDTPEPEPEPHRNWFCGNIWKTGCAGDGWTGAKGTVCKPCNEEALARYNTQWQSGKEHQAMLESLKHWYDTVKPEAQVSIGVCPHCGRDCVIDSFTLGVLTAVMYIDQAELHGTKWKPTKYCRQDGSRVDI